MCMIKRAILLLLVIMVSYPCFAREPMYVAVVDFSVTGDLGFQDPGKGIAQMMIHPLQQTHQFKLFERILLRKVLDEQYFSETENVDDQKRANKAGELYGVAGIVTGSVVQWGDTITVTAQLLDTTTGELLKSAQVHSALSRISELPQTQLPKLAKMLAGKEMDELTNPVVQPDYQTPKKVEQGHLTVRSNVYQDQVWINNKSYGSTRLDVNLPEGQYEIRVSKSGYDDWMTSIFLSANSHETLRANLKKMDSDWSHPSDRQSIDQLRNILGGQPEHQTSKSFNASGSYDDGVDAYDAGNYKKAYDIFFTLAKEQNHIDAQNYLAYMYREGIGVRIDYYQAAYWYQKTADQGSALGQVGIGRLYETGRGVPRDYQKAIYWYRKAANQGDALGQSNLGIMYRDGLGVKRDYHEAVRWFRKSAEQDHASGQVNLGYMYRNGFGVRKNLQQALYWYTKSAEQGHEVAQNNLAIMYRDGDGVNVDYSKAFYWFEKAAKQGYASAQNNLARLYETGKGVTKNEYQASYWYGQAAKQGDALGQSNFGIMYRDGIGVKQDYYKALEWFKKSANQGHASGQSNLGYMYREGLGVTRDYRIAFQWYKKAADQNHASAQSNLGYLYREGLGVPKDRQQAIYWFKKAAAQGDSYSKRQLRKIGQDY